MADVVSSAGPFAELALPRPVPYHQVEDALFQLRCDAPCAAGEDGRTHPITRACMSNLIVYCNSPEEADSLPLEFAAIARRHPARIILLVAGAENPMDRLETHVSAQLVETTAGPQVVSEQIRISVSREQERRLPSAARPFLIGDLPTSLWWSARQPPPEAGEFFRELSGMASSVVYDSRGWPDPRRGMLETARWVGAPAHRKLVADLAWLQLRFWRQLIAETLAPGALPGALAGIERIEVEHGPHAMPMAWLLIGWLAHCLAWSPGQSRVHSQQHHELHFAAESGPIQVSVRRYDEDPLLLRSVRVYSHTDSREPLTAHFESRERDRLIARVSSRVESQTGLSVPHDPRVVMLAWQLTNRTGQPVFRDALAMGRVMANAVTR